MKKPFVIFNNFSVALDNLYAFKIKYHFSWSDYFKTLRCVTKLQRDTLLLIIRRLRIFSHVFMKNLEPRKCTECIYSTRYNIIRGKTNLHLYYSIPLIAPIKKQIKIVADFLIL